MGAAWEGRQVALLTMVLPGTPRLVHPSVDQEAIRNASKLSIQSRPASLLIVQRVR